MRIRRAHAGDVPGILALRDALAYGDGRGGFLLGTDAEGYRQRLADGLGFVLEDDGVAGLALVLPDAAFRRSDVWQRREAVQWLEDPAPFVAQRLGYYDQLGVARGPYRRWGAALALTAAFAVMEQVDHLVTTTVASPICNLAAVPYIERLGGRRVGHIDEVYPEVGPLVSDLWLVEGDAFRARVAAPVGLAERWLVARAREALTR